MKTRLQKLWKSVKLPGHCPQPEPDAVLRRVSAALDEKPRRRILRPVRYAFAAAAALLLLNGAVAVAAGQPLLPEWNVLDLHFSRGGNSEYAKTLVNAENYSVSDDDFTLSVTSSIATERKVYFTVIIQGETEEARQYLESLDLMRYEFLSPLWPFCDEVCYISFKLSWADFNGSGSVTGYDSETGSVYMDMNVDVGVLGLSRDISVYLHEPEKDLVLKFPVNPIKDMTVEIHAEGQGRGSFEHAAGGPVTLEKVTVSPLDVAMEYRTPSDNAGIPVLFFLWKDGTWSTWGQLGLSDYGSGHGEIKDDWLYRTMSSTFDGVQDISQMEAVVFEGTAYPLDGSEPYETDVSALPRPFNLTPGEVLPECIYESVPMFALCDTLGIPYTWDEESGTAVMRYRDVTMRFSLDSELVGLEGAAVETAEMDAAPIYQDGELWADAHGILPTYWNVGMHHTFENSWLSLKDDEGNAKTGDWVVIP